MTKLRQMPPRVSIDSFPPQPFNVEDLVWTPEPSIYDAPPSSFRIPRYPFLSFRRVGGIRFLRIGRLNIQWSVAKKIV